MRKLLYIVTFVGVAMFVNAADLEVTSDADDGGAGTLRTILGTASSGDTIVFADDVVYINLTNGYLDINSEDIDIDGGGNVVLDANGNSRLIKYRGTSGLEWSLTGLTFKNGYNSDAQGGGAVRLDTGYSSCDLLIRNCSFINNSSANSSQLGGAIFCSAADPEVTSRLLIEDSTFKSNGSSAVYSLTKVIDIKDTLFEDNWGKDGGVFSISVRTNEVSTWDNVTFLGNKSSRSSGALRWSGGFIDLNNCTFDSNFSESSGGACYLNSTTGGWLNFNDCSFYNNTGGTNGYTSGGAVVAQDVGHNFVGCTFTNNSANSRGGAIYIIGIDTTNTIYNCTFVGNKAASDIGGAVGVEKCFTTGIVVIANCTFTKNISDNGVIGTKENRIRVTQPSHKDTVILYQL
jgi:predicted outer membrane repeat protein